MFRLKTKRDMPYVVIEILPLAFIFITALYLFEDFHFAKREWIILFGMVIVWCVIAFRARRHYSSYPQRIRQRVSNHIRSYLTLIAVQVLLLLLFPAHDSLWKKMITVTFGIFALDMVINFLVVELFSNGYEDPKYVLVAGTGSKAKSVEHQVLASYRGGYQLKGFIECCDHEQRVIPNEKVLGNLTNINQYLQTNTVDEIVIALNDNHREDILKVMSVADYYGIRTKYVLDYHEFLGTSYKITRFGQMDAINIRQTPVDERHGSFFKNCFDKLLALVALILLAPLFLFVATLIKLESPGPVFYCPVRIGKGGKPFKLFKFRSMRENDDASAGTLSTCENDPRITRIGRVLRKYSIDELPQLINVFLGSMSLVGPRPHRRFLNRQLQESVYNYMLRHYVKPGITGWAQVNGWRGPTDTEEQKRQRTIHDLWYIENWSFWLDIKIIFLTVFAASTHKKAF